MPKITLKQSFFIFVLLILMQVNTAALAAPELAYTVSFPEPHSHYAVVSLEVTGLKQKTVDFKLPVWAPGSYLIREFPKNIDSFEATGSKGEKLRSGKITKNTWRVQTEKAGKITITYKVYAYELSVRTSYIDIDHAYLNGSSIFMYPEGQKQVRSTLEIKPHPAWQVISTGLPQLGSGKWKFTADNYDVLADSPIEIGNQKVLQFEVAGVPHEVAMFGEGNYDETRLLADMQKICAEAVQVFGTLPVKRYVFIVHNIERGGGGLEHLNSTTLQNSRTGYQPESAYTGFLSLVAHEYFHLWNIKRLRPAPLGPFNYDQENYTTLLWVSEGITSYYDDLLTRRAGFYTPERYLEIIAGSIGAVENNPGNKIQTVAESSFDAWIKFYRRSENTVNAEVSYYTKGGVLGLLLDLEIMKQTKGEKTLDDVFRYMYDRYYVKLNRGFTEAEFKEALEKVSGSKFDAFFRDLVHGTTTPDYDAYLAAAGLKLVNLNTLSNDPYLGAGFSSAGGKYTVTSVSRNGAAWQGGLYVNDEILAVNGMRLTDDLNKIVATKKPGDQIEILVNRDGRIRNLPITLIINPGSRFRVERLPNPTETQQNILKKWLRIS